MSAIGILLAGGASRRFPAGKLEAKIPAALAELRGRPELAGLALAVAAAAQSGPEETRMLLLIIGLALSIPLIIFGSSVLLKLMDRFPIIITLGAGLLGLLAGGMLVEDPAIKESMQAAFEDAHMIFEGIGVAIVILLGTYLKKKNASKEAK